MYWTKFIEMISLLFIVIGALNWGLIGLFKLNLVELLASYTAPVLATIIYIVVGISALVHIFSRDYYLPFLGSAVYPCGSLVEKTPYHSDTEIRVKEAPKSTIVYWASEPNTKVVKDPWQAYDKYANNGVTNTDEKGMASLKFRKPSSYKVPSGKTLKPHVHYRVCTNSGMLGPVKTVFVDK